ncbi:MAG TPA: LysR family transcriptional regulator [Casimicrobiaceae bacterium]|jgi:DNA-binding transcriptional LysR family regulator|nr:LysR family transcriptional regulator [Casimicrobiaceae bacterium]
MELYQLRGFVAVAESGHLTRAADKLHVSQPALSAQVKAVEDELGVTLFERTPSGMALSVAGRQLLPHAQAVLAAAQALRNAAHAIEGELAGHARVGTVADPKFVRLPQFLARAVERHPLLEIMLQHEVSGEAFDKVRDDALDASFYYGDRTHPHVASVHLTDFAYRIVAPVVWRERVEGASFQDIARLPWIMTPEISTHRALTRRLFDENGIEPATRIEADHEAVISSLVVAGLGVSLMREDIARAQAKAGEIVLWDGPRLLTSLQFLYAREREAEPVIAALIEVVRDVWPANVPALVPG